MLHKKNKKRAKGVNQSFKMETVEKSYPIEVVERYYLIQTKKYEQRVTESFQIETAIRFTQFKPKSKGERDYRKFQNRNSRKGLCNLTIKSMCERGYWKF